MDVAAANAAEREQLSEERRVLVRRFAVIGGEAKGVSQPLTVVETADDVGVTDVGCEQHVRPTLQRNPGRTHSLLERGHRGPPERVARKEQGEGAAGRADADASLGHLGRFGEQDEQLDGGFAR